MNRLIRWSLVLGLLSGCASDQVEKPATTTGSIKSADSLIRVAKKARKTGNPESAINFYNKALEINSERPEAYLGIAEAYIDLKLLDAALEYIRKAEVRGADKGSASYLKGKVYLLLGKLEKAEKEFKESKTIDSLNALGAICDNRGEHQQAQQYYKQVITKDPEYIDAYNNMGLSLMLEGKYRDAIFYLENACTLPDAGVIYRSNLALVYGLAGNMRKAQEIYAKDFEGAELEQKIAYLQDLIAARSRSKTVKSATNSKKKTTNRRKRR